MPVPARTCGSCSTPLPEGASYCPHCGVAGPTEISDDAALVDEAAVSEHRERLQRALGEGYVLRDLIGSGGFGVVYRAWDVRLERAVAVKALRHDLFPSPMLLARFEREAKAAARLRHPNIVPIYAVGEGEGVAYMIMPLIEGQSLRAVLTREGTLPAGRVAQITVEAAMALHAAHAAGIVHRDVKPENVMLEADDERVLLMDFGIAKSLVGSGTALTDAGAIIGSLLYMSPEQACGDSDIDGRTDVYSLGCVAYEALTGVRPFEAENLNQLIYQHATSDVLPIAQLRSDVPQQLAAVVMRSLEKEADARWPSARDFADALWEAMAAADVSSTDVGGGRWHRSGHLFWLGHDLQWTADALLRGAPVAAVRSGLESCLHHIEALGLESDPVSHYVRMALNEIAQVDPPDFAERRVMLAQQLFRMAERIGRLAEANDPGYSPGPLDGLRWGVVRSGSLSLEGLNWEAWVREVRERESD